MFTYSYCAAAQFFSSDVDNYRSDRLDNGKTYSLGASINSHFLLMGSRNTMMISLDSYDPRKGKVIFLQYGVSNSMFRFGPIPCTNSSSVSYPLAYRTTLGGNYTSFTFPYIPVSTNKA